MNVGETLRISTDYFRAMKNIPDFFRDEGQNILRVDKTGEDRWEIFVQKVDNVKTDWTTTLKFAFCQNILKPISKLCAKN